MYSFLISMAALILGYLLYGKFVDRIFSPNPRRVTPAITKEDGVDFVPLPNWKVFMIQFLNIAGTGPIFGAIMGAKFGPSCYLWIVFGCIFAGAVHDYLTGMLSLRHGGVTLPDLVGKYMGRDARFVMLIFSIVLLLLVGTVFVYSPAMILGDIAGLFSSGKMSIMFWVAVIFVYYILATLLPIDKVIARIYPLFAVSLLFMAVALSVCLVIKWPDIPEFWQGLQNRGPEIGVKGQGIFPCLFITVACGAISGFHSTQTPIMARCLKNENLGRPIFYGAMVAEGIVALIWAAVSSYFFFDGGQSEVGAVSGQAPEVVSSVAKAWLGTLGGVLAIIGVVAAPITSGDTAFRSARLILSDFFRINQKNKTNRLIIAVPLFAVTTLLLWFNIANEDGFNIIWRYFGLANQSLACFTLWMLTVWLSRNRKGVSYMMTLLPASFLSAVCLAYFCTDKIGFNQPMSFAVPIGVGIFILSLVIFYLMRGIALKRKRLS
ncbi:MAG: carbon starvation protein A [Bacteroidales bacterium]|nr:carbon starvation protein A [Bacteroidales bacterium]